jgi:hypothetical protein
MSLYIALKPADIALQNVDAPDDRGDDDADEEGEDEADEEEEDPDDEIQVRLSSNVILIDMANPPLDS